MTRQVLSRMLRWLLFFGALGCLAKSLFGYATRLSVAGFFVFGVLWWWMGYRLIHSLDSPKPR